MKPLGFIILAVILVVVVGLTLACCYWCPDYYFSGCTPADILGKKKPSARPLESTPLIVTTYGGLHHGRRGIPPSLVLKRTATQRARPRPRRAGPHRFPRPRCLNTIVRLSKREGYSPRCWKCRKRRRAPRASAAARRRLRRDRRDAAWPRWTASRIASKELAHWASGSFPCSRILSV